MHQSSYDPQNQYVPSSSYQPPGMHFSQWSPGVLALTSTEQLRVPHIPRRVTVMVQRHSTLHMFRLSSRQRTSNPQTGRQSLMSITPTNRIKLLRTRAFIPHLLKPHTTPTSLWPPRMPQLSRHTTYTNHKSNRLLFT